MTEVKSFVKRLKNGSSCVYGVRNQKNGFPRWGMGKDWDWYEGVFWGLVQAFCVSGCCLHRWIGTQKPLSCALNNGYT